MQEIEPLLWKHIDMSKKNSEAVKYLMKQHADWVRNVTEKYKSKD